MAITPAHDVVSTSPTNTFATLNPLGEGLSGTLSDGNLKYVMGNAHNSLRGNFYISSGKWYWEVYVVSVTNSLVIGLSSIDEVIGTVFGPAKTIGFYSYDGKIYYNSTSANYDSSYGSTDIIGVFLNLDDNQLSFYKNGSVLNSGTTIDLSNATYNLGTLKFTPRFDDGLGTGGGATFYINFGVDSSFGGNKTSGSANATDANDIGDFYYAPPTGALALCTANIQSDLAIDVAEDDLPEDYFQAVTWTNHVSNAVTVPLNFKADLIWVKSISIAYSHRLQDSVQGYNKYMNSNGTGVSRDVDSTFTANNISTTGFDFNGTYNTDTQSATMCAWCWKAGGQPDLTSSPTKPFAKDNVQYTDTTANKVTVFGNASNYTITPTSASIGTKQGFSIVKYTGNGTAGATVPHGLGKAPDFIILKNLESDIYQWEIQHKDISLVGAGIHLNNTTGYNSGASDRWDYDNQGESARANINVVTLSSNGAVNDNNIDYIMYSFASIPGFSAFGTYEGNAAGPNGPYIHCGFRVAWLMIKNIDSTGPSWDIYDNTREPFNDGSFANLSANSSGTEGSRAIDFLSNGFKIRETNSWNINSTETFLFACFAEMPQKYAVAR